MSDLAQLLAQFEREECAASGDAQLPEARQHAVRSKVVRARRIRSAATIAVAAVALVACGTGAWALTQTDRHDPAVPHPSPSATTSSPSPSPSPSATAEPVLTMPAFTGDVTVDPQLPTAEAITPEAWNAAGPGWVLATYREKVYHYDDATRSSNYTYGPQVAYLVSPDGTRYQLTSIGGDEPVYVVEWDSGSRVALSLAGGPTVDSGLHWVTLDLVTGDTRPLSDADVAGSGWRRPNQSDIQDVMELFASGPPEDIPGFEALRALAVPNALPTEAHLDAALATAQDLVPAGEVCKDPLPLATSVAVACGPLLEEVAGEMVGGWYAHEVIFVSARGSGTGAVVDVRIPNEYGPVWPDPSFWDHPWQRIGDSVVAMAIGEGPYVCPAGRYVIRSSGIDPLPGVEALKEANSAINIFYDAGVVGSSVYTVVTGGCSGSSMPEALVRDDVANGTYTTLIPLPQAFAQEAIGDDIVGSIESAYVVGSRP